MHFGGDTALLTDIFESLTTWVENIIHTFGLPGVALIALFENLFPPTPSEFLYPLAGKLVADGTLTAVGVITAGIIGSLAGSLIYYSVGYKLGEARIRGAIGRFGHIKLWRFSVMIVSLEDYDRAVVLFQRWGGPIVVVARIMPFVHSIVSVPAGVTRMSLFPFIVYTAIGSALWIAPLTLFGLWLGNNWEQVLYWMDVYEYGWYAVMVVGIIYLIVRRVQSGQARHKTHTAD